MYFNIQGKITHLFRNSIIVEVNNIGYQLFVSRPKLFSLNKNELIYTHLVKREDEEYLVGFKTIEEKEAFLTLLKVKGIGPKTALTILGNTNINELYDAINNDDIYYLKKIPGVGNRCASQILLDLKGSIKNLDNPILKDVSLALVNLGFKKSEITNVINKINTSNLSKEEILREALKALRH